MLLREIQYLTFYLLYVLCEVVLKALCLSSVSNLRLHVT